jgi:hypothetical protein
MLRQWTNKCPVFMSNASSLKPTPSSAPAKRLASDLLSDDFDSENVDPATFDLPTKRAKGHEGTPTKVSKFTLLTTPKTDPSTFKFTPAQSLALPTTTTTTTSTPISHSRGSPKNRRIAQLSTKRRSSTTIRRFDPPTSKSSPALPFSIDAALQGTISSYTPSSLSNVHNTAAAAAAASPSIKKASAKAAAATQPASWFFAIHEDSPDQEATNLLLHNASTLDISSDDDAASARAKDAAERGKENVPPPEYVGAATRARNASAAAMRLGLLEKEASSPSMSSAMDEDRKALREMDVSAFWPEGKEELVIVEENEVVVEAEEEKIVVFCGSSPRKEPVEVQVLVDSTAAD